MLSLIFATLLGFVVLIFSADQFVAGASALARRLGIDPLVIGLTVVAFGTSLPELLVSLTASLAGNPQIALGNAIGSNITNIGLVLGVTALIMPLKVEPQLFKRDFPLLCLVMLLVYGLALDGEFGYGDGIILLTGLCLLMIYLFVSGIKEARTQKSTDASLAEQPESLSIKKAWFLLILGLILMPISSKAVVSSASELAHLAGISELVIGLSIVAIGTSLPELVASLSGAYRGEYGIAIGNVIGSNLFNLLGVIGFPAFINSLKIPSLFLDRDFFVMTLFTFMLYLIANRGGKSARISRSAGALLFICYIAYNVVLSISATD